MSAHTSTCSESVHVLYKFVLHCVRTSLMRIRNNNSHVREIPYMALLAVKWHLLVCSMVPCVMYLIDKP